MILPGCGVSPSGRNHLHDQQSAAGIHRPLTVIEDREALFLAPVMNDVREQIGIATARNPLEEAARLDRDALRQAARLNQRGSVANDMREVEQDAMRFALNSMSPQDDGCSTRQDVRIGVMRCSEMFCPFPTANQTA